MTAPVEVRPAAVAGAFYPGRTEPLRRTVDEALAGAGTGHRPFSGGAEVPGGTTAPATSHRTPKALIVPHAGYVYSGGVAATAYAQLVPDADQIRRVVLLGPAHRVAVASMAISAADAWATPLGEVAIDAAGRARVAAMPGVVVDEAPHRPEHALEVQVPFLQRVLGSRFELLPIIVGPARPDDVADVLDAVWGGDETVIVVSTDLSHYLPSADARRRDASTIEAILHGRVAAIGPYDACGAYPLRGLLVAAARHGLDIENVDARNSGDTAGPKDRVVGYASFVLHEPEGA